MLDVTDALVEMLIRVDEGLELLFPCSDQSLAMALGGQSLNSPAKPTGSEKRGALNEVGFDDYHTKVISLLVKISFDSISMSLKGVETNILCDLPVYLLVFNMCRQLVRTRRPSLLSLVCRFCLAMQSISPISSVAMEKSGLQRELFEYVVNFIINHYENGLNDLSATHWGIFCNALTVLQKQAVALHHDSQELLLAFSVVILRLWIPALAPAEHARLQRCSNCESEMAKVECLHERWVDVFGKCFELFLRHDNCCIRQLRTRIVQ